MAGATILLLILVAIAGLILTDNLIKKIVSLNILNSALVILFVWWGSLSGSEAPILLSGVQDIVDPLPQALVVTSIVIGLGVTTLAIALCIRLYEKYGTFDISEIRRLKG